MMKFGTENVEAMSAEQAASLRMLLDKRALWAIQYSYNLLRVEQEMPGSYGKKWRDLKHAEAKLFEGLSDPKMLAGLSEEKFVEARKAVSSVIFDHGLPRYAARLVTEGELLNNVLWAVTGGASLRKVLDTVTDRKALGAVAKTIMDREQLIEVLKTNKRGLYTATSAWNAIERDLERRSHGNPRAILDKYRTKPATVRSF